jgi:protein gp37
VGEQTSIAWCHHTFNYVWGCQRVSPGCERCYAETFAKRVGLKVWGPQAERRHFGDKHWAEPLKWARAAEKAGERRRVFCSSMADVFEDRRDLDADRARLFELIEATPALDWLLLTKRPENMVRLAPTRWAGAWPRNVWAGTTAEDNVRLEQRVGLLRHVPAVVRFLSCEPLLEDLDLEGTLFEEGGIHWVIGGGESGPGARPCHLGWLRNIVHDCDSLGMKPFIKQMGQHVVDFCDRAEPEDGGCGVSGCADEEHAVRVRFEHRKGEDPTEWEPMLRRQEFPEVRS